MPAPAKGSIQQTARQAVVGLAASLLAEPGNGLDSRSRDGLDRAYFEGTSLFFRLLVIELARRAGRLPDGPFSFARLDCVPDGQFWPRVEQRCRRSYWQLAAGQHSPASPLGGLFALAGSQGNLVSLEEHRPGGEALRRALDAAVCIGQTSRSPSEMLFTIYEDLLRYRLHAGQNLEEVRLVRSDDHRKASGAFYTPRWVVRLVVEAALKPVLGGRAEEGLAPRVMDPAMGTGVFLLEALRYLAEYRWEARGRRNYQGGMARLIAEESLHGVDGDPLAVQLAICSLWLETGAQPAVLGRHLRCDDFLADGSLAFSGGYDVLVGNPPWGARYSPQERERLRERFPLSTRGPFDSFKLFLDYASALSRGTVGMVVPQAVLGQETHADIREVLLNRLDPYAVIDLGDGVFPGAAAPACALVFGPKPGPAAVECAALSGKRDRSPRRWSVRREQWDPVGGFSLADQELLDLLHRLQKQHPTLGQLAHLFRIRDTGINYNRASVARRVLYRGKEPEDPRDVKRFRGRSFHRYTGINQDGWLRCDAQRLLEPGETLALDWATYRRPEKIVFRQTADRIVATLDRTGMAMGRSVIAITPEGEGSLRALLAYLNSRLLTLLYRALAGEEGRVLPQVKVGRMAALPIPAVCSSPLPEDVCADAELTIAEALHGEEQALIARTERDPLFAWACLDRLTGLLLQANGQDAALDRLVDQVVHRLYGIQEDIAASEFLGPLSQGVDHRFG